MNKKTRRIVFHVAKRWFDMYLTGAKKEEYRRLTPYWTQRLTATTQIHGLNPIQFKSFDEVVIYCGYPKRNDTTKMLVFEHIRTYIGKGNPAIDCYDSDMKRFIIKIGRKIEL